MGNTLVYITSKQERALQVMPPVVGLQGSSHKDDAPFSSSNSARETLAPSAEYTLGRLV